VDNSVKQHTGSLSRTARWAILVTFVVLWYALIQGISRFVFHVALEPAALPQDLAAHLIFAGLCYSLSGRLRFTLPTVAAFIAALNLCNAGKIQFYGTPAMPDDFIALPNLFLLLAGWQLAGAIAIVVVPFALLMLAINWRHRRTWLLLGLYALAAWGTLHQAGPAVAMMDKVFGNSVWNQRGNLESRGIFIHLVQESLRHQDRSGSLPSAAEVETALAVLRPTAAGETAAPVPAGSPPRNVHMIVLESFWDAALLTGSGLSMDPLDPRFRELWQQAGNSHVLSPIFGGYTANAEFESLCGFPVTENHVYFESGLRNQAPCLPQILEKAGYRSIASHPNVAGFWNRVNAYRRIGFRTYWSDRDFVLDDLNGEFLSDSSLYRQTMAKIGSRADRDRPVFNFLLTYFGHVDYPLNAARPKVITTTDKNALLNNYVNLMYYKSRELMDFLATLRRDDPDGLIVLFGDHLPFLGPGFYGYLRSQLLTDNRATMTDRMVYTLTATPLVVIDGRRGPLPLGDLPMYRLPALILHLLGLPAPDTIRLSAPPEGLAIRPLPGMYWAGGDGRQTVCREERQQPEQCAGTDRWLQALITVSRDLFSGSQFVLTGDQRKSSFAVDD
jgi:phosphoglycerol transferase MdoB-like AlkP superfamily enzyme